MSSQIDMFAIKDIDDTSLACYIPIYGARIATRRYCMDKQRQRVEDTSKVSLLNKLRQRMSTRATNHDEGSDPGPVSVGLRATRSCSRNAVKTTRKIELGWIHEGKQVRKRCSGGTRVLDVNKNATKKDLLSHAKELFFPHDKSKKGNWGEFTHNVYDFKESELDDHTNVGELYTVSKFGILRFYLYTACQAQESDTDTEEDCEMGSQRDIQRGQQVQISLPSE